MGAGRRPIKRTVGQKLRKMWILKIQRNHTAANVSLFCFAASLPYGLLWVGVVREIKTPNGNLISVHEIRPDSLDMSVLETAGVPVTGGPPIFKFIND